MSKTARLNRLNSLATTFSSNISSQTSAAAFNASLNFLEDQYNLKNDDLFYVVMKTLHTRVVKDEVLQEIAARFSLEKLSDSEIYDDCKSSFEIAFKRYPQIKPPKESTKTKQDLIKIAEELYQEICNAKYDGPDHRRWEDIRAIIDLASIKEINGEKGFAYKSSENFFIIKYLITEKKLLNDKPDQLLSLITAKISPHTHGDIFAEIAGLHDLNLLKKTIEAYLSKTNRNTNADKQTLENKKNEWVAFALNRASLFETLRDPGIDDKEKYLELCKIVDDSNAQFIGKLFAEANFANVNEYIDAFMQKFSGENQIKFLTSYEENFIPDHPGQTAYSRKQNQDDKKFIPIDAFLDVDIDDKIEDLNDNYYQNLAKREQLNQEKHARYLKKYGKDFELGADRAKQRQLKDAIDESIKIFDELVPNPKSQENKALSLQDKDKQRPKSV